MVGPVASRSEKSLLAVVAALYWHVACRSMPYVHSPPATCPSGLPKYPHTVLTSPT